MQTDVQLCLHAILHGVRTSEIYIPHDLRSWDVTLQWFCSCHCGLEVRALDQSHGAPHGQWNSSGARARHTTSSHTTWADLRPEVNFDMSSRTADECNLSARVS